MAEVIYQMSGTRVCRLQVPRQHNRPLSSACMCVCVSLWDPQKALRWGKTLAQQKFSLPRNHLRGQGRAGYTRVCLCACLARMMIVIAFSGSAGLIAVPYIREASSDDLFSTPRSRQHTFLGQN